MRLAKLQIYNVAGRLTLDLSFGIADTTSVPHQRQFQPRPLIQIQYLINSEFNCDLWYKFNTSSTAISTASFDTNSILHQQRFQPRPLIQIQYLINSEFNCDLWYKFNTSSTAISTASFDTNSTPHQQRLQPRPLIQIQYLINSDFNRVLWYKFSTSSTAIPAASLTIGRRLTGHKCKGYLHFHDISSTGTMPPNCDFSLTHTTALINRTSRFILFQRWRNDTDVSPSPLPLGQ